MKEQQHGDNGHQ